MITKSNRRWRPGRPAIFGLFIALLLAADCRADGTNGVAAWAPPRREPKRLLVVTVAKGYQHASIIVGERVVRDLAKKSGAFSVVFARTDAELAERMSPAALQYFDGVFFLNTTGILPLPDKAGFLNWIKSGRGFIGTHSATDTFHGTNGVDPYIEMIGGEFARHTLAQVDCRNDDPAHPANRHFHGDFPVFDEIYILKNFSRADTHVLLSLDRAPGSDEPGYFPISWCKPYGQGRVFYTALGHEDAVWESPEFQLHLLGGIKWALGLETGSDAPQKPAPKESVK